MKEMGTVGGLVSSKMYWNHRKGVSGFGLGWVGHSLNIPIAMLSMGSREQRLEPIVMYEV